MLKKFLYVLIALGVIRGLIRYNEETGSDGIERVLVAFIEAVADITYRWLPAGIEIASRVLGG